jgi:hypothetical protein
MRQQIWRLPYVPLSKVTAETCCGLGVEIDIAPERVEKMAVPIFPLKPFHAAMILIF